MEPDTLNIKGRVQRNPYGMVAGALGLGFVLGGGLFTRLTARMAGAGLRIGLVAVLPLVKEKVFQATGRALAGTNTDTNEGESS